MNDQQQPGKRKDARSRAIRTVALLILGLAWALSPLNAARASGIIWLPLVQATSVSGIGYLHPALVTDGNHAYIVSTADKGKDPSTVYFTTNESGTWQTQVLSTQGPTNAYSSEFATLTSDPATHKLYAVWFYRKSADDYAVALDTRDASGAWTRAPDLETSGFLGGEPSVVVAGGKLFVAFESSNFSGSCDDSNQRSGDIQLASFDGTNWSVPQNLTSCVVDSDILEFENPRLTTDETGHLYLLAMAGNNNLWYLDNAAGNWSAPQQITSGVDIGDNDSASSPALRVLYGLAVSQGTASVVYAQRRYLNGSNNGSDVYLITHPAGGAWSAPSPVSPADPAGCIKYGLSILARGASLAIAYIHAIDCHGTAPSHSTPQLAIGTPGQLHPVAVGPALDCGDTALTHDGDLLSLVVSCGAVVPSGGGNLYYQRQYLDTIGPVAHLTAPAHAKAPSISLRWSAKDPAPGAGVAYFQLQVKMDSGKWSTVLATTQHTALVYTRARAGHRYTFRLRARDRVNNWGKWVSAKTQVS